MAITTTPGTIIPHVSGWARYAVTVACVDWSPEFFAPNDEAAAAYAARHYPTASCLARIVAA